MCDKLKISIMGEAGSFWTPERVDQFSSQAARLLINQGLGDDINEIRVSEQCVQNAAGQQVCRVYLCYKSKYLYTAMDAVFDGAYCLVDLYAVKEE